MMAAWSGMASEASLAGIYCAGGVSIDGKLDEPIWQQAPAITDFRRPDGKPLLRRTEARIVWTPTAAVIGFKAYIPKKELIADAVRRDGAVCSSDCVEVMIDPAGGADSFKHIIVNAANSIFDRACEQGGFVGDDKWNGDIDSAVYTAADFWSCEIKLPYRTLGIPAQPGRTWSLSLARESFGNPQEPREISSIANGTFNVAGEFRKLTVPAEVDLAAYALDINQPEIIGKISDGKFPVKIKTTLHERGERERKLRIECKLQASGVVPVRSEITKSLAAGKSCTIEFSELELAKPGDYQGTITIRDIASNRLLLRCDFPYKAAYVPIQISLIDPHYRDAIFTTQKLDRIRFEVEFELPAERLKGMVVGGIRTSDGRKVMEKQLPASKQIKFEFANDQLPEGRWEAFAELRGDDGKILAATVRPFRKLSYLPGEIWRGKDGNWYREGQKLFINSCWNRSEDHYPAYNVILGEPADGDERLFYNPHTFIGVKAISDDLKAGLVTPKVLEFYRKKIDKYKNHPRLFGHFLCDEPDIAGYTQASFIKIAEFFVDYDPYHPVMICPGSSGLIDFAGAAEITAFHCYPRVSRSQRMSNFDKIVYYMDKATEYFTRLRQVPTITYLHQGFDYSDCGNTDTRIPDYSEFRNQDLLALILGSRGLMHYNRGTAEYPELYIGMPELAQEQWVIGNEAIIEADSTVSPSADNPKLRMLAKHNTRSGDDWLLVCNTMYQTGEHRIKFAPFASRKVQVLSENRSIQVADDGTFTDHFTPYQVHVYTTSRQNFKLRTVDEIERDIATVYARRATDNAGNLAYQRHENETVRVTASSNKWPIFRAENVLWHVANGVTSGPAADYAHGTGILYWHDATRDSGPDWLELEFINPVTVGKVVVWPVGNALKDYEIQIRDNGQWRTVGSVPDAQGSSQTVTFTAMRTDAVRLLVTATRGGFAKVFEVQVFEK